MNISDFLVLSDMDGTLLQVQYGVPKENIEAIDDFVARGGNFSVSTGRSVNAVKRYGEFIKLNAPAITNNGAVIYDFMNKKVLYQVVLNEAIFDIVERISAEFPEIGVEFHTVEKLYATKTNQYVFQHCDDEYLDLDVVELDYLRSSGIQFNKVLLAGSPEFIDGVEKYMRDNTEDRIWTPFSITRSNTVYVEILPKGVNKGNALRKVAELTGKDLKHIVVIGDYYNDLEMFGMAGYCAAVNEAPDEVKAAADIVTEKTCLQGAVGEVLETVAAMCDGFVQLKLDM